MSSEGELRTKLNELAKMQCPITGPGVNRLIELLTAIVDRIEPPEAQTRSAEREPPHRTGCICADCSGAELTADND